MFILTFLKVILILEMLVIDMNFSYFIFFSNIRNLYPHILNSIIFYYIPPIESKATLPSQLHDLNGTLWVPWQWPIIIGFIGQKAVCSVPSRSSDQTNMQWSVLKPTDRVSKFRSKSWKRALRNPYSLRPHYSLALCLSLAGLQSPPTLCKLAFLILLHFISLSLWLRMYIYLLIIIFFFPFGMYLCGNVITNYLDSDPKHFMQHSMHLRIV